MVFRANAKQVLAPVGVEIQIATMLSSQMWEASHPFYEDDRVADEESDLWQWQPNTPRFVARQLGHTLHLADGLLSQLRKEAGARTSLRMTEGGESK
jgi:hypothetical protein